MGNVSSCCGGSRRAKADRARHWGATGIVGLRDQKLKEIPSEVENIQGRITTLDATNNRISRLPDFVLDLSHLQRLELAKNALSELPNEIGRLSQLKILVVDENQLTTLPDGVGELSRIEKLSAASNNIVALPDTLGNLGRLKHLEIRTNKLKFLPTSLENCPELEILNATDNYLEGIPENFGQLKKLKSLGLDNNRISIVPAPIFLGCIALQTLSLHANPVTIEVLQATEGWEAFENRRQTKANKIIAGGAMMGDGTMDEGVDRRRKRD